METCPSCGVPFDKHLGLIGVCERYNKALEYICKLQRAIEAHCRGEFTRPEDACHHAIKLDDLLFKQKGA